MSNRINFTILLTSGILFLILFLILSFHNRPAADDFFYIGCVPQNGIFYCMQDLYLNYSARWTAYSLTGFIALLYTNFSIALFLFNIITISILILLLYNILKTILGNVSKIVLPRNLIFVYTLILTAALFFTSFGKGETWFWLVQVCTYLWSLIAFLAIIYVIINDQIKRFHYFIIFIAGTFIGGASESYSLIFIFLLVSFLIILNNYKYLKPIPGNKKTTNYKIIFSTLVITTALIITIIGPGNEVRLNALPDTSFIERVIIPSESFLRLLYFKMLPVTPLLLIFCSPWIVLGDFFSTINKERFRFSFKPFIYFLIVVFVYVFPTSLIMSELGPDRALSIVSFSVAIFLSGWFYYIGFYFKMNYKFLQFIRFTSCSLIVFFTLFQIFNQYNLTSFYAKAYEKRISFLKKLKQDHEIVEVPPLPPSGMLYSAEITEDPSHFTNRFLVSALNLKYKVKRAATP